jgi:4-aminobutyrate aminotransferase-like enzyme/Ser/Thr protein kinase RdoA (MazF antagonist)
VAASVPLTGEVNQNFEVVDTAGNRYILKLFAEDQADDQLALQTSILEHLSNKPLPFAVPRVLKDLTVGTDGGDRPARLFTYLSGTLLADCNPLTPSLLADWGRCCAQLGLALRDFDHPAAHRTYHWDPLRAEAIVGSKAKYLGPGGRATVAYVLDLVAQIDFSSLPKSVNHNDAHERNVLADPTPGTIRGVIDFDDVVYTATVCELAIACAYAAMDVADPLGVFRRMVGGYTEIRALTGAELEALFPLICARLLLTVTHAAANRVLRPDNPYLTTSERQARDLLERLINISPPLARAHLRTAAGLTAHPGTEVFTDWAASAVTSSPIDLPDAGVRALDLSIGSHHLGSTHTYLHPTRFTRHLRNIAEELEATLLTGGYGEARPIYTSPAFRGEGNSGRRHRSVHLGLDFWSPTAGITVRAVTDGTVAAVGRDATPGGYGHVILLRHEPRPDLLFYTLYGHLSAGSADSWRVGTKVAGGAELGATGVPDENGGWPPHLHFQILLDELGYGTDFPGVAYPEEAEVWLSLCPDPRTLIPGFIPPETGVPNAPGALLERRKRHLGPNLSVSYQRPLQMLRGWRQELYDHTGRRYLDTVNNVAHVGHEHPRVVRAASRQAAVLNTNSRYLHPTILDYAEALKATLPPSLSVVYLVNSGSEANELALRMARTATGSQDVLAMEMGYHGNTGNTIAVSSYKFSRRGGGGRPEHTHLLPAPDPLRELHLDPLPHLSGTERMFIHESILSCAGQRTLPPGYLRRVYGAVQGAAGACIADEVQTGLGRVGSHWWAFEAHGVHPDIVTMGKPLGNGHPLGAVVCTPRIARAFANGMEYFNTFGGNPVSSATGLAVLQVVREEGLREQATAVGDYLIGSLRDLAHRHPIVTDVRGSGLFLGVELCHSDLAPASAQAAYVKNRMRELGILMSTDGPHENVLKIKPPLCFDRSDAAEVVRYLDRVMGERRAKI